MKQKSSFSSDGFAQEVLPLIKDGLVIFRSILDSLIERIEEAEKERDADVRKDIYSSIIDALEAEMKNIEKDEPEAQASRAKVEVIEAIISALMKESEQLEKESKKKKKSRRARKVKID